MLNILPGFPDKVLAIEGKGEITAEDYKIVLIPAALSKLKRYDHLRLFCHLGPEFKGLSSGAMWEDLKLGVGHWGQWGRAAIVSDIKWIVDGTRMFAPLFHSPMRAFPNAEYDAAKAWVMEGD